MRIHREACLWISAVVLSGTALQLVRAGRADNHAGPWQVPAADSGWAVRDDLGDAVRRIVSSDPFRLDRRPAELPFGATPVVAITPERRIQQAPKVSGILGPPWRAALEGVPGRAGGVLVAAGDTIGLWRVVSVRRDSIVIQSPDTTWRLAMRRPQ